jgi:hypothetical protein
MSMNLYQRMLDYHSKSRPTFVLFTEFIAFVATMTAMLGIAFLRDWLF